MKCQAEILLLKNKLRLMKGTIRHTWQGLIGILVVCGVLVYQFFFVMENFLLSLVWLGGLFVIIFIMIAAFWKINRIAAYLQIPYAAWVLFAGYLNAGVYFLN